MTKFLFRPPTLTSTAKKLFRCPNHSSRLSKFSRFKSFVFPSRQTLLLEINRFLAAQWEEKMVELAGGPAHEVSEWERIRASFLVMSQSATLADLRMTLDAADNPEMLQPWLDVMARWSASPDDSDHYLLQIIADGLWVHDHINGFSLSPQQRQQLTQQALMLFHPDPG